MHYRPNVIINEVVELLVSFLNCKLISSVPFIVRKFFLKMRLVGSISYNVLVANRK